MAGPLVTVDGLGGAHWVLIQHVRRCLPGDLGGAPGPAIMTGTCWGELLDVPGVVQELSGFMLKRTTTAGARERAVSATAPIGLLVPR